MSLRFRRVLISTGSDYYLSLQGFAPHQTAYATYPSGLGGMGHGPPRQGRGAPRCGGPAVIESRDGDRSSRTSPARVRLRARAHVSALDAAPAARRRRDLVGRGRNDDGSRPMREDRGALPPMSTLRRPQRTRSDPCVPLRELLVHVLGATRWVTARRVVRRGSVDRRLRSSRDARTPAGSCRGGDRSGCRTPRRTDRAETRCGSAAPAGRARVAPRR